MLFKKESKNNVKLPTKHPGLLSRSTSVDPFIMQGEIARMFHGHPIIHKIVCYLSVRIIEHSTETCDTWCMTSVGVLL